LLRQAQEKHITPVQQTDTGLRITAGDCVDFFYKSDIYTGLFKNDCRGFNNLLYTIHLR